MVQVVTTAKIPLEEWQVRMLGERDELAARNERLASFLRKNPAPNPRTSYAGNLEHTRMENQLSAMCVYFDLLNERIGSWVTHEVR